MPRPRSQHVQEGQGLALAGAGEPSQAGQTASSLHCAGVEVIVLTQRDSLGRKSLGYRIIEADPSGRKCLHERRNSWTWRCSLCCAAV